VHGGAPSVTMLRAMTHPIRRHSRPALLLALALLAAVALPERSSAAQTPCPTFQVQHNDRIGKLRLRAGTYDILIGNQRKLSCSSASDHFRQFLEDYDGTLPDGWRVQARKSRFVQRSSGDAFRVRRVRGGGGGGGGGSHPATGRACPAPFSVLNNDSIGDLKLKAGKYRITLLAVGRLSCTRASKKFTSFLDASAVPTGWRIDLKTATFSKSSHYGFRVKPFR
jgi:hypothetical protein